MVYPIVKFGNPVLEREADNVTGYLEQVKSY
jgi:hypothetical protein